MMTNAELQSTFKRLNDQFFDGRIKMEPEKVRFGGDEQTEDNDGLTIGDALQIFIHEDFKDHPDIAQLVLLHEMAHAELLENGYVVRSRDGGHAMLFYARIDKLYNAGAYEGLL